MLNKNSHLLTYIKQKPPRLTVINNSNKPIDVYTTDGQERLLLPSETDIYPNTWIVKVAVYSTTVKRAVNMHIIDSNYYYYYITDSSKDALIEVV